jgi:hypothetical protein
VIGLDGSVIRFTNIDPLPSSCPECDEEKLTRMFCNRHREGKPCNWCADRRWRVLNGSWVACKDDSHEEATL